MKLLLAFALIALPTAPAWALESAFNRPTFATVQPTPAVAAALAGASGTFQTTGMDNTAQAQPAGNADFTGSGELNTGSRSLGTNGISSGVPDVGVGPTVIGGSAPSGVPTGL